MGLVALKVEDLPHYTYDDYVQWEGQWELIKGIPYAMVPAPALKHQDLSLDIAIQLKHLLAECEKCHVYEAVDWQIEEDTVARPDVLVVCAENPDDKKLLIPPVLVFEILSPSTTRKDKILKYQLYQDNGVKYYCIVDPKTTSADVFILRTSQYDKVDEFKDGKITFDLGPCTITFDFGEIFKE
jgi:Uma2 family endonuclease